MKIFGDLSSHPCTNHQKESGLCFGTHDILRGANWVQTRITHDLFGQRVVTKTVERKIHLHIFKDTFSTITGKLREYLLPWRWKSAFLDAEDGSQPQRVLVCTSEGLNKIAGRSWLITNLIAEKCYTKVFGKEFLYAPATEVLSRITHPLGELQAPAFENFNKIVHPLGEWYGLHSSHGGSSKLCHFFRKRSPLPRSGITCSKTTRVLGRKLLSRLQASLKKCSLKRAMKPVF